MHRSLRRLPGLGLRPLLVPLIAALALPSVPLAAQSAAGGDPFGGFDEVVERAMAEWHVPGVAVAALQDGEVVFSRGYGHRDVEAGLPVTPRTLFAIGSNTKSFTATLLGMLADDGVLDWDTPVREYLPDFRMRSDVATEQMTPEDLVTHRSGLPRHDLLWYGSDLTRGELYDRLRYLEPSEPFRYEWQYQNLMFMTAGHLAERLTGKSWEALVDERILAPLGMERTGFSVDDLPGSDDFAYPYAMRDSQVVRIPYRNIDEIGPAGSINSSVEEMVRYIEFHIAGGTVGEERLLSEAASKAMQRPQMTMPGDPDDPELGHDSYGRGLVVGSYRGHGLVRHGGGIDGFISYMAWLPRDSIGVMVLTNLSGNNPVPAIVAWNVLDRLLGLDEVDWIGRIRERQAEAEASEREEAAEQERVEGTFPSHPLADYAGRYEHPAYGAVRIEAGEAGLRYAYGPFEGPLEHWHYDVFRVAEAEGVPVSEMKLTFGYDEKGDIDRLSAPLESEVDPIVFERAADESMRDPAFLSRLAGEYELGPRTVTIAVRGDELALTVPGQPTYTLDPDRGTSFDLRGLPGYRVEFTLPETGPATQVTFHQPNGTFVAIRK